MLGSIVDYSVIIPSFSPSLEMVFTGEISHVSCAILSVSSSFPPDIGSPFDLHGTCLDSS